jgi:hypothetical protein
MMRKSSMVPTQRSWPLTLSPASIFQYNERLVAPMYWKSIMGRRRWWSRAGEAEKTKSGFTVWVFAVFCRADEVGEFFNSQLSYSPRWLCSSLKFFFFFPFDSWILYCIINFGFENLWAQKRANNQNSFWQKIYDSCIEHTVHYSNCNSESREPCSTLTKSLARLARSVRISQLFLQDHLYPGYTLFISVTSGFSLLFVLYGLAFTSAGCPTGFHFSLSALILLVGNI